MLLRSRGYIRQEPSRDAKLFIIFCEGEKTEQQYFKYFKGISSQINIEIIPHSDAQDNSPTGLLKSASSYFEETPVNSVKKYSLIDIDEVWFIIDTDSWAGKIDELRISCNANHNWFIAQSNPCFEVWLYYHFRDSFPIFPEVNISKFWKSFIPEIVPGGFDSRRHPIFIEEAIANSSKCITGKSINEPGTSEVYLLGRKIYELVKYKIIEARKIM